MTALPRQIATVAAVMFALAAPASQAITGWGLTAAEFSSSGDGTLRAAGYAFSIWGVIYAGLIAYGVFQALQRHADRPLLALVGWPAVVAIAGCGAWICAAGLDARWATVAIITLSAATLTAGLMWAVGRVGGLEVKDRMFVLWPLSLLAGWLTIAAAINILTVLTAEGLLQGATKGAAFAGVLAVLIVALGVLRSRRMAVYGVPVAWGLVAVWVAERATKGDVAVLALGAAVVVGAYAAWQFFSLPEGDRARSGQGGETSGKLRAPS